MKEFFLSLIPTGFDKTLMSIGASAGAISSFLFGEFSDSLIWLCVFLIIDFFTGWTAAWKRGELSSAVGTKGIIKKVLVVCIVILCHGLDVVSGLKLISLREMAIFAFSLNEVVSILENIDRLGFGGVIPDPIRKAVKALHDKQESDLKKIEDSLK